MRLTNEYVHEYHGWWSPGGECVVRAYEAEGRPPVIICSAVAGNTNTSITNICEILAVEVVERNYPRLVPHNFLAARRARKRPPFVWVEHYPPQYRSEEERGRAARGEYVPEWVKEKWWLTTFKSYRPRVIRGAPVQEVMLPDGSTAFVGDGAAGRRSFGHPEWEPVSRERVEEMVGQPA